MFYCDKCASVKKYPMTVFKSDGRCEICLKNNICNELSTSRLLESII